MGTGGSLLHHSDDEEVMHDGVVKNIPIEFNPRPKIGRFGLRSVKSLSKAKASSSMRSALSVDLEDPEVTRIRRDFEMYKMNKENELQNMQKKLQIVETENRKLRAELQTLHNTTRRLREERDQAQDGERHALARAASIESDKEKIQRQFKIFRETKESELQCLLKSRRDLESKLSKYGHVTQEDLETSSRLEMSSSGGNPGDWWTLIESEPSMGSTTQLHTASMRGPELAHTMMEMEGPYVNVNKEDWHLAMSSLSQVYGGLPESLQSNLIRVFLSASKDVHREADMLVKDFGPALRKLCAQEGRFFNLVYLPCEQELVYPSQWSDVHIQARYRQIEQANVFVAFLGEDKNRFTDSDINMGHLNNPGAKPAIFCLRQLPDKNRNVSQDIFDLHKKVKESGSMKLREGYDKTRTGVEWVYGELVRILQLELGIDERSDCADTVDASTYGLESAESLCGGSLWDTYHNHEQLEMLTSSARSTCELGFEKYYEIVSDHVSTAGLLPPLLISGSPGCGKSLLLVKWIELQRQRSNSGLVLHHFVSSPSSTDPVIMIRRLTAQLMHYMTSPPSLTSDPVRLVEEFPKWLEKVSTKLNGGITLVLDSADRIQNGESELKWLLDPLPVDLRVVVSVNDHTCPVSWKSWPTLNITNFSNKNVKELLHAELAHFGTTMPPEMEAKVLTHCRTPQTCNPLYVVIMASDLAKCNGEESMEKQLTVFLQTADVVEMYKTVIDMVIQLFEPPKLKGYIRKVLQLIYASRNGLSEMEIHDLLPGLVWNFWAPVCNAFIDRHFIAYHSGLLTFAHAQARYAVELKFFNDASEKTLNNTRIAIRDYFGKFTLPGDVTYRVADELPWLSYQLEDKEQLYQNVLDLCIFVKLYGMGRCGELIGYWQHLGVDKITMSEAYYKALKMMEGMVGQFDGLVTLPRIADVYEALGRFLRDLNLLNEALTPLQRALEIRELALDPDHPSVGQSLHQLAGIHAQQGKYSMAEQVYKQSWEIFESAYGTTHYLVAREMDALAVLYQKQGKHELAEPLHKRALSIRRKSKVPRPFMGHKLVDPLRRRALQLEELAMGPETTELARTLNEIGVLYYLQTNIETAEAFFKRSLEVRESVCGPNHPDVAQSLNNLGALYYDRKHYDKAEPLYERALTIRRTHFPADHASVASIIKHLGMLYKKANKLSQAEPLYKEMAAIRERSFGASHPSSATALVNLAVVYSQQGKHSEALPLYERALKVYEESLGPHHARVAETLKNLALLKYEQGEYETAAKLYKRSNEIKEFGQSTYTNKPPSRKSSTDDSASTLRNTRTVHTENLHDSD